MWPGNDASGPNMSTRGLCEALADDFRFSIIARSRPFGPGPDLDRVGEWHDRGFARLLYLPVGRIAAEGLIEAIADTPHDALLMNSVWDREFTLPTLAARRLGRLPRRAALLSTRGEFSDQALALKPARKALMRRLLVASGALDGIALHATSEIEAADVARAFPRQDIFIADNVRPLPQALPREERGEGRPLRAVFVGRVSPVKGLDIALEALTRAAVPVHFTIYGPLQDAAHWQACQAIIARLPAHVSVDQAGEIAADAIPAMLAGQDVLLMPSHSENFGHAIFEALAAGVPALIGPNTPWQALAERHAGMVLPLTDHAAWAAAIDRLGSLPRGEWPRWRAGARAVARGWVDGSPALDQWRARLSAMAGAAA